MSDHRPGRAAPLLTAVVFAAAASAEPLAIRDQNPLIRGAYLPPGWAAVGGDGWQLGADLAWSNTVNSGATAREQLLVDEETTELDVSLARSAGPWRLRATLPLLNRSAGILDGFIDDWHRLFGLPRGARPSRPRNGYVIGYATAGGAVVDAPRGSAFGDLALEAGRVLTADAGRSLALYAGIELPTGERRLLTGNGALDAAIWLEGHVALGTRLGIDGRAGVSHSGGTTPLAFAGAVGFGTASLSWRATPRLEALLQLDAHSAVARSSDLPFLQEAVALTLGGRYRLDSGSVFEAGVVEDIEVDHSPDVTFRLGWRSPLGRRPR